MLRSTTISTVVIRSGVSSTVLTSVTIATVVKIQTTAKIILAKENGAGPVNPQIVKITRLAKPLVSQVTFQLLLSSVKIVTAFSLELIVTISINWGPLNGNLSVKEKRNVCPAVLFTRLLVWKRNQKGAVIKQARSTSTTVAGVNARSATNMIITLHINVTSS